MSDLGRCPICGVDAQGVHDHTASPNDSGRCTQHFMLKVRGGGLVSSRCLKHSGHEQSKKGHGDRTHKARKPGGVVLWK